MRFLPSAGTTCLAFVLGMPIGAQDTSEQPRAGEDSVQSSPPKAVQLIAAHELRDRAVHRSRSGADRDTATTPADRGELIGTISRLLVPLPGSDALARQDVIVEISTTVAVDDTDASRELREQRDPQHPVVGVDTTAVRMAEISLKALRWHADGHYVTCSETPAPKPRSDAGRAEPRREDGDRAGSPERGRRADDPLDVGAVSNAALITRDGGHCEITTIVLDLTQGRVRALLVAAPTEAPRGEPAEADADREDPIVEAPERPDLDLEQIAKGYVIPVELLSVRRTAENGGAGEVRFRTRLSSASIRQAPEVDRRDLDELGDEAVRNRLRLLKQKAIDSDPESRR